MIDAGMRIVDGKLHGLTIERFCAAIEWRTYLIRRWVAQRKRKHYIASIEKILTDSTPNKYLDSERIFAKIQNEHLPPEPYGYDSHSTWRRASERVQTILTIPGLRPCGKRVLELAAGDGMTGRLLHDYGHDVTLCDIEDWRDNRARSLLFLECDVCQVIPLEDDSFDLIYSYNSFEHLADPFSAFREIERLCRPNGVVILSFGPLYCSPWGLHVYRALNMPYPQFLFSRSFICDKVSQLGIYDLGRRVNSLQPLNGWRFSQFQQLWRGSAFQVIEERVEEDWSQLDMVMQYPKAFRGRNLGVVDLVTQAVHVQLMKMPPPSMESA